MVDKKKREKIKSVISGVQQTNCTVAYKDVYRDYREDKKLTAEEYQEREKKVKEIQEQLEQEKLERNKKKLQEIKEQAQDELLM